MKTLNLSDAFLPVSATGGTITKKSFSFSGGEVHIKLQDVANEVMITTRLNTSDDVMQLLLAVDALQGSGTKKISAFIPYLPYARQDRVMVAGEPLSVKVMCNLLNGCDFERVYLYDVHSEVAPALLNHCEVISNNSLVQKAVENHTDYLLVSPDAGALKKIYKTAQAIGYNSEIVLCNKLRDVSNGNIKQITVDRPDLEGKDCFIVDDICDGGATFVGIAKALRERNAGKIFLVVSHGIFSHGEAELTSCLEHIYTTDSISSQSTALITRLSLAGLVSI